jgi:hypothetical protein
MGRQAEINSDSGIHKKSWLRPCFSPLVCQVVWIGGLRRDTEVRAVYDVFKRYGTIDNILIDTATTVAWVFYNSSRDGN